MNLIPLLAALVPWAATPLAAFTRIYVACSILSLEMQLVTWLDVGSLRSLPSEAQHSFDAPPSTS